MKMWICKYNLIRLFLLQPKQQTPVHIVASRQTATATSILRILLAAAGKDIRLKVDGVSIQTYLTIRHDRLQITSMSLRSAESRPRHSSVKREDCFCFENISISNASQIMSFNISSICVWVNRNGSEKNKFSFGNSKISGMSSFREKKSLIFMARLHGVKHRRTTFNVETSSETNNNNKIHSISIWHDLRADSYSPSIRTMPHFTFSAMKSWNRNQRALRESTKH